MSMAARDRIFGFRLRAVFICRHQMSKPKINESDLCRAARRLRTSTAEVETVAEVESRGEAFYPDGFPVILFERHKFRKFTEGKFNKSHPAISGPAGNYGKAGPNQQKKFNQAFALDPIAAMKSCSWGKFQIMGFNYAMCGYDSVGDFVDAMKESEGKQLDAFVAFVISAGLADELRAHKWAAFAEGYNGSGYRKNDYHNKLPKAFEKFSKRKIHCGSVSAPTQHQPTAISIKEGSHTTADTSPEAGAEFTEGERPDNNERPINVENVENVKIDNAPAPSSTPVTVTNETPSIFAKVGAGIAAITGLGIQFGSIVTTKISEMTIPQMGYLLAGLAILGVGLWLYDRSSKRAHEKTLAKMATAADPSKNTVEIATPAQAKTIEAAQNDSSTTGS